MHELSLMEDLLALIEAKAAHDGFTQVQRVVLTVGRLAMVEAEALAFCFESVVAGTIVQGAALEIMEPPGLGWCVTCQRLVEIESRIDPCSHCGQGRLVIRSGTELRVEALEVL